MVKKQELEEQLSYMRSEMEAERRAEIAEGDRQVSDALNGRMDDLSARMDGLENALTALANDFDARVAELEDALEKAIADPELVDFGRHVIPRAIDELRVQAHFFEGYWEDVGTIGAYYQANLDTGVVTDYTPPTF